MDSKQEIILKASLVRLFYLKFCLLESLDHIKESVLKGLFFFIFRRGLSRINYADLGTLYHIMNATLINFLHKLCGSASLRAAFFNLESQIKNLILKGFHSILFLF
ncbi:MAG: hypothetical protein BGO88_05985 [Flavobacterium sp. 38-13]|nr:MAG: hypothetical protein BGO88_05985 [Flavobacterium sp. 38-13]